MTALRLPWLAVGGLVLALTACGEPAPAPAADTTAVDTAPADGAATADAAADAEPDGAADVAEPDAAVADTPDATGEPDAAPSDAEATDAAPGDATDEDAAEGDGDTATADATPGDAGMDGDGAGGFDVVSCKPGAQQCEGAKLATCGPKGDGYIVSNCFPGMTCVDGGCKVVSNNLIIVFDSSGSMTAQVKNKDGTNKCGTTTFTWPTCDSGPQYPTGCNRMGVSKHVFTQAMQKIDEAATRMALFRFPQKSTSPTKPSCSSGYYSGQSTLTGDAGSQSVDASTSWYWNSLDQTLCVPFPADASAQTKAGILKWMDNNEAKGTDPELRPTGGTPIGKTLFYVGEYLRNKVVVDGKACAADADCGNVNYACKEGKCVDPSRSCRETVVVLFTDGGESNSPTSYFAPWVQAKRMSTGLACTADAECVGGATCQNGQCLSSAQPTGYMCDKTGTLCNPSVTTPCTGGAKCVAVPFYCATNGGQPCQPFDTALQEPKPESPLFCPKPSGVATGDFCFPDPRLLQTAKAGKAEDNVLRSPDGKPFGVRVHVVDISGSISNTEVMKSMSLALSGNGKLLGADASDPQAFLSALDAAFDFKNKKLCGQTL